MAKKPSRLSWWWEPKTLLLLLLLSFIAWEISLFFGLRPDECIGTGESNSDDCPRQLILLYPVLWPGRFARVYEHSFVALGAIAVALFTATLWWSTNKLWQETRDGGETTKKLADATLLQANVMMDAERARLVQSVPLLEGFLPSPATTLEVIRIQRGGHQPSLAMKFGNIGKTAAFFRETRGQIAIGTRPRMPEFTYAPVVRGEQIVRSDTQTEAFYFGLDRPLTQEEIDGITAGAVSVWFYGYLRWVDTFDILRERGFCFESVRTRDPNAPWISAIAGGSAFNYEKTYRTEQ